MKKVTLLQTILVTFLCSPNFVLTNSTGVDQKIITSSETNTNVSNKIETLEDGYNIGNSILEPSIDITDDMVKDNFEKYKRAVVSSPIKNSEESKNILSNDTPVILTLSESSTIEVEKIIDAPLISTSTNEKNSVKNVSEQEEMNLEDIKTNVTRISSNIAPENSTHISEDLVLSNGHPINISENQNEEIPSFSEWTQKRLEEVEKYEQINSSTKGQSVNGKGATAKLRWKNYASLDCGAKVIAANPESVSPGAILSPSSDEYKLNACTSRIWFIVELCEAIQAKRIDLANYELFSSSPKDFIVSVSDRYPTRDWSTVGKFTAKDERDIQNFDLDTHIFGKYIKVEIKSHYGSEHYCPISLFRAYGTSVFEVLQKEDPGNTNPTEDDDDDDDDHIILNDEHDESQKNLFSSATDAVMSIVKRAAEVLGNKVNNRTSQEKNISNLPSLMNSCKTPNHLILCKNCSETFFQQVYEIISCDYGYIKNLLEIPSIYRALSSSWICHSFGYDIDTTLNSSQYMNSFAGYILSFFNAKYICALCHEVSVLENKGIFNISQQFSNGTENITTEQMITLQVQEPQISNSVHTTTEVENVNGSQSISSPNSTSVVHDDPKSESKENVTYVSQIKPTKTLTSEVQISQTDMTSNATGTSEPPQAPEKPLESAEYVSSENVESNLETPSEIEGMDALDDHLEHFIPDFISENNQNTPITTSTTTNTPQAQKESVFLRLSNRIKVLERNMSLSSQYLEELSRRYKKQVEEMQHLLEKTIVTLREESLKKDIRNKQLEDRLDNLTAVMESLVAERHNWILSMYCLTTGALVLLGIYFFCRKRTTYNNPTGENKETPEILRRKSIDVVTHNVHIKKKRRPSDQALKIVRCSALNIEESKHKSNNQRQRKRKKRNLARSNSISNIKDNCYTSINQKSDGEHSPDWIERNHQAIEDIPFALEESDNTTLEAYPLESEFMRLNSTDETPTIPYPKLNRNSSQNHQSHNVSQDETCNHSEPNYFHNKGNDSPGEPVKKEKRSFKRLFKKVF